MACFAILCIMVLAIPLVLPVAKAHAFLSGLTICSQAGVKADTQQPDPLAVHADCSCVLTCHGCTAGKVAKALQAGWALALATPETVARWSPDRACERPCDARARTANAIRGPPFPV